MTSLVLYIGIAVTFLTVWGVIMVLGYLLGRETASVPAAVVAGRVSKTPPPADRARLG